MNPARYAFDFDDGGRIVSDGTRVVHYDERSHQASARAADTDLHTVVFLPMYELGSEPKVTMLPSNHYAFVGSVLQLEPQRRSTYKRIIVFVRDDSETPDDVQVVTPERNLMLFVFHDFDYGFKPGESQFTFEAPEGTTWAE